MRRALFPAIALLLAAAPIADASKTRLRLERIDASDFSSDGVVKLYASVVELEGQIDDERPGPAFTLKLNGKNLGHPTKATRFQMGGDPLDLVLIIESSALYGAKPVAPSTAPVAPPPQKAGKAGKAGKGKRAPAKPKSLNKRMALPSSGDEPLDHVKEAVEQLLDGMPPAWKVFLIDYGADVTAHSPFRPAGAVEGDVEDLSADGDAADLRLTQAVDAALIELHKQRELADKQSQKPARRLIVLISDGLNFNMDRKSFRTLGLAAAKELVPIHAIAFSPTDDRGPLLNLGEISKLSNGTFRWARNADDLKNQIETLADELSKQYVLSFKLDESSLEGKTFQLVCGDLVSNPLQFGAGFSFGGSGKRGLGWWWLLIAAGALGLIGLLLIVIANNRPEVQRWNAPAPRPQANAPAPQPQQPAAPRGAVRVEAAAAQPVAAAAPSGVRRGVLIVVSGQLGGTRIPVAVGGAPVTVGKGPATLQITDDPTVSTRHAQLQGDAAGIVLYDLGSTNGTFVNNHRISQPTLLSDGDLVRFGNTQIKFRAE